MRPIWSPIANWLLLHGLFRQTPVIVYQMAKVGSSSVVAALRRARLPVFHVHRMSAEHLARMRGQRHALGWRVPPIPKHDRLGLQLNAKIIAPGRRAKIVTLVRDPIARNFSSYFEHLDAIWNVDHAHEAVSIDDLCRGFLERYPHDDPLTWFDDEFLPILGIDIYRHPFPAAGHTTVQTKNLDILVLRSELGDEIKRSVLSSFFGKAIPPLRRVNETRDKRKGAIYEEFCRTIRLPDDLVARMTSSRYYRHFYA